MDLNDLLPRFAVALGVGLLIGLERGWRTREEAPGSRTAGIRTFSLTALLGLAFAAYAGVFSVCCRDENRADQTFSAARRRGTGSGDIRGHLGLLARR